MGHKELMEQESKALSDKMADFVNSFSTEKNKLFAEAMAGKHRTLQQNFTRLCIAWFQQLAVAEYYDDRNQASVELARKLKPILDDTYLPFI